MTGPSPIWAPFLFDPARAAVVVDFDGSLAPIVDDPARAAPVPGVVDALGVLAGRMGLVAVVSGRPVEFLRRHLARPGIVVVGQYGLETEVDGRIIEDPRAVDFHGAVVAAAAEAEATWPHLLVERKGRVACTIHWRTAPDAGPAPGALADLGARHGLTVLAGRMACELRPPLPVDKGTALARLLAERSLDAAAFAGDDYGDLAAFAALVGWADAVDAAEPVAARIALRIAVASDESPAALMDHADLVLAGPRALATELAALAEVLSI